MQPTLCSKCKKNVAVVFISRMNEKNEMVNEGLCLKCAAQLGLPQVEDMMKRMGITPEDLENINSEMMQAFGGAEELGDVLMQVVFHADIEKDAGRFTMDDVCDGVVKKLLFRHPHVFGDGRAETADTVTASWDELKRQEKGQKTTADALDAVARSLPGLWRAEKIQKKAAEAGFDWRDVSGALDKLDEETAELRQAVRDGTNVEEELGDVLFAAVKVGRFCGVDPETAVNGTCEKFIRRFRAMEEAAAAVGRSLSDMTLEEMTALWNGAKECS